MALLRSLFPFAFQVQPEQSNTLVKGIVIHAVAMVAWIVLTVVLGILGISGLPLVGIVLWLVGTVVELYCVGGIVLSILKFVGVIKE